MTNKLLKHKGYLGSVDFDLDEHIIYGRILHIQDLVDYSADNIADLKNEFIAAVDDYLALCAELGESPNKPASGTFNVRVGQELHLKLIYASSEQGISLNEFVKAALCARMDAPAGQEIHNHYHIADPDSGFYTGEAAVRLKSMEKPRLRLVH